MNYLIDPNLYRNAIQKSLTLYLGREVIVGKAKISLWGGIGIAFEDFRIRDSSLSFDLLQSKRVILMAKIIPLLKREVKWKRIVLEQPTFLLLRDKNGRFNLFDAPLTGEEWKASQRKMIQTLSTLFGGSLTVRNGMVSFSDGGLSESPLITEFRSFDLRLRKVSFHKPFPFRLSGKIIHSKKEGKFSISGTIENIPEDMDLSKGKVKAGVEIKDIEISHFWPYVKTLLPMKTISGTLDLNTRYQGDLSGTFKTSAKIKFRDLVYEHPRVFAFTLKPKLMNLNFDADYDLKDFRVSQFSIELPEIKVNGKGKVYGIGTKEMGLEAEAASSPFDLSDGKRYIPYRIITPKVSDPLFRAEGNGPVQILSARLSGKIPEIEHCDQTPYAHTLSVEMKVNGARVKLPWNLPALEDLKAHLIFKEGHLNLKEIEGKVLHSSIDRADGIFEQLLQVSTLQIHCHGKFDLADLLTLAKMDGLASEFSQTISSFTPLESPAINGGDNINKASIPYRKVEVKATSFLTGFTSLSGRAQYQLFFKGQLKPPLHFRHQGVYHLSKVRFIHSQIPFPILIGEGRIDLSNESLQWSEAKVEFGNSSLLTNGSWKKMGKGEPLEITIRGRADFKNLLSLSQSKLFSEEIRSKTRGIESLSGVGQFSFKGRRYGDNRPFSYEVGMMPKEVFLLPKGLSAPLTLRDGSLSISDLGTTFSKVKIQSGNSILTLDGSVKQGGMNLSTSGSIDLRYFYSTLQSPLFPNRIRSQISEVQELAGGAEVRLKWLGRMEEWTSALRDGEIRLKGVSFKHQKIPVPLSHIEGTILFSPEQIRCDRLKGKFGDSPITLSSVISRISTSPPSKTGAMESRSKSARHLSFQISSSHLDLDPIFPKSEKKTPTSFEKIRQWLLDWSIDGKVEADQGKYRGLHYQDLNVELKAGDGKLLLYPFQFKADGGDFWGEGWIQPLERGIRFEIKPRLSNIEARAFLRILLQKEEEERIIVTGRVHINKVQLRGEGEDFQKVKESLNGMLRLELENGVIERGNILSKIFSILNVSQLFKGRLPDLKTKGLPYHRILANIDVKDGIASTDDFVVDSDAMRITIIGKVDLGKNLIDARIGIHPLVTLDTVLSHIPIIGYILTGKEKAFLSYVYEVKGDLNDPKIEAIPFKSIGEGFLGIIKRLLETPLRPFQKSPSTDKEKK
jgi:uncharacterized protein involved in outer membrane biogenesis